MKAEWWWLLFRKNTFLCHVRSRRHDVIKVFNCGYRSLLFYVGLSHNLVREIWVVHVSLRSFHVTLRLHEIFCDIEGHVDFWGPLQGQCIFFLYRLICQFLIESLQILNCGHWKRNFWLPRYYATSILKLRYLHYWPSDWAKICFSKIRLTICIWILTWYEI